MLNLVVMRGAAQQDADAVSMAFGSWSEAGGSALQQLLNVGALIVVGALALRGQRLIWQHWAQSPRPAP